MPVLIAACALCWPFGASRATTAEFMREGVYVSATSDKTMDDRKPVATAREPAVLRVRNETSGAEALELTARPLTGEAASAYLVQVFLAEGGSSKGASSQLLGSFSFLPVKVGRAQTFILPKPADMTFTAPELRLSIKLVAANAARTLDDVAVEITAARLVK